ncbi:MAG: hypothetical protein ACJ786_01335 [Catenulispora sp.]
MVRVPNPLDAAAAVFGMPVSVAMTAMLRLTDPGAEAPVYGLAGHSGLVSVDGFDADGARTLTAIALGHGDTVDPAAPLTVVGTDLYPERHPDADHELRRVAATLAFRDRMLAERRFARLDDELEEIPGRADWTEATIEIVLDPTGDARCETALVLPSGHWAVSAVTPKARVTVSGRGPCPERVRLAAVTDFGPYHSGTRSRAVRLAKRSVS